jgi:hypothetical protein
MTRTTDTQPQTTYAQARHFSGTSYPLSAETIDRYIRQGRELRAQAIVAMLRRLYRAVRGSAAAQDSTGLPTGAKA